MTGGGGGGEEGSGVMPMYTRLVPAAARSGTQSRHHQFLQGLLGY